MSLAKRYWGFLGRESLGFFLLPPWFWITRMYYISTFLPLLWTWFGVVYSCLVYIRTMTHTYTFFSYPYVFVQMDIYWLLIFNLCLHKKNSFSSRSEYIETTALTSFMLCVANTWRLARVARASRADECLCVYLRIQHTDHMKKLPTFDVWVFFSFWGLRLLL